MKEEVAEIFSRKRRVFVFSETDVEFTFGCFGCLEFLTLRYFNVIGMVIILLDR